MKTAVVFLLLLSGLSRVKAQKPVVLASASIFQDIAHEIGGELIDAQTIVPIGGDPHIYEPTPADAHRVYEASLILLNGLTFEGWIRELIDNSGSKAAIVTVTEGIEPLTNEIHKNSVDPHAWMTAQNGLMYATNTYKALKTLLPDDTLALFNNYTRYISQLRELDQYIKSEINKIPEEHRILITSHDAFQYYGRHYGLKLFSVLGTSTDADVQTSDMIKLTETILQFKVPAIFIESTINPKLLQQIAHDTNCRIGGKLFADSLGEPDSGAGTYLTMLRSNTVTIVSALSAKIDTEPIFSGQTKYILLGLGSLLIFLMFSLSILRK